MALIRCPNCDTLHELEGTFFALGPRKVRCASCRTIWEASDPEASSGPVVMIPKLDATREKPAPRAEAQEEAGLSAGEATLDQSAIDAMDFSAPEPAPAESAEISAEELEALFAEDAKLSAEPSAEPAKPAETADFDPESLARAQDAAIRVHAETADAERRERQREMKLARTEAHHRPAPKAKARPITAMVMAAGLATFGTVVLLRQETIRLFPASAQLFESVGLGVARGLDIGDVRSRLVQDESRETLEVTGTIVNHSKAPQKIPVMRLSIRTNTGQEIYVWTANADQNELAPGEKTRFSRRLASPPAESHSVQVRFVAKDDIVAAIR